MNGANRNGGAPGSSPAAPTPEDRERIEKALHDDTDGIVQGLTPQEIQILAQKVYDLLRDEFRMDAERAMRRR